MSPQAGTETELDIVLRNVLLTLREHSPRGWRVEAERREGKIVITAWADL